MTNITPIEEIKKKWHDKCYSNEGEYWLISWSDVFNWFEPYLTAGTNASESLKSEEIESNVAKVEEMNTPSSIEEKIDEEKSTKLGIALLLSGFIIDISKHDDAVELLWQFFSIYKANSKPIDSPTQESSTEDKFTGGK